LRYKTSEKVREGDLLGWLAVTILPPILVYVFGFVAIPWIASGFKSKQQ
jgi:hypothetical protein